MTNPKPRTAGQAACNSTTYNTTYAGSDPNCTSSNFNLCPSLISSTACYCTTYGLDDQCYVQYYVRTLTGSLTPITGDSTSTGLFRFNQTQFWHKFEFALQFTLFNYAALSAAQTM